MGKYKKHLGIFFLWVGSLALLSALGGALTLYYNKLVVFDRPLKLVGFSLVVTLIVFIMGIILLVTGRYLIKNWTFIVGASFLTYCVFILLIIYVIPIEIRFDILLLFSFQYEPALIAIISLITGCLFIIHHLLNSKVRKSVRLIFDIAVVFVVVLFIFWAVVKFVIPKRNVISNYEQVRITIRDMQRITTAIASYITDKGTAPNQQGIYDKNSQFYQALSPVYIHHLPLKDQWGNNFRVYCGKSCNGKYGLSDCLEDDVLVVSYGRDGREESWEYNSQKPNEGFFAVKNADDFNNDLVMWFGNMIRAPENRRTGPRL